MGITLEEQIAAQTQLIEELENGYKDVEYFPELGRHHKSNRKFNIHHTNVRDAYWRRRMLVAKLENFDLNETAKLY